MMIAILYGDSLDYFYVAKWWGFDVDSWLFFLPKCGNIETCTNPISSLLVAFKVFDVMPQWILNFCFVLHIRLKAST